MAIIQHTSNERDMLARLMRAEAIGEGDLGMLMVGNVVINRALADCLTFINSRTISDVILQETGGFSGKDSPLFFSAPTALEKKLADLVLDGKYFHPATHALWFYAPKLGEQCSPTWWEQQISGRYKNHCFYIPEPTVCKRIR